MNLCVGYATHDPALSKLSMDMSSLQEGMEVQERGYTLGNRHVPCMNGPCSISRMQEHSLSSHISSSIG